GRDRRAHCPPAAAGRLRGPGPLRAGRQLRPGDADAGQERGEIAMMRRLACLALATALGGCASSTSPKGTLAELRSVEPEIEDVRLDDSLDLAAQSYRRYLQETPVNEMTPEA